MNWKDVPIPELMQDLPRDKRGFPVPAIVGYDRAGEPLFTINDMVKTKQQHAEQTCGICGKFVPTGEIRLVGGPVSAFHPVGGVYIDGPVHQTCGQYALQVCPYLAAPRYAKRIDAAPGKKNGTDFEILMDPTVIANRPLVFVMIHCVSYNIDLPNPQNHFHQSPPHVRPVGDAFAPKGSMGTRMIDFEVWREGVQIEDDEVYTPLILESFDALEHEEVRQPTPFVNPHGPLAQRD